jgi:hypothetical protein
VSRDEGLRAARALVRAEGRGLRELRTSVRTVTLRLAGAAAALPRSSPRTTAEQAAGLVRDHAASVATTFTGVVLRVRQGAKEASRARFAASWESVRRSVVAASEPDPGPFHAGSVLAPTDQAAAAQAGQSLGAAWMSVTVAAAWTWAGRPEGELAAAVSAVDLDGRMRRIAATESARAYADDFDEDIGWAAEEHGHRRWFPAVFKRWEACNDRNLCVTCRALGQSRPRPIRVPFPGGHEPGYVHAHCRCVPVLIYWALPVRETTPVDDEHP